MNKSLTTQESQELIAAKTKNLMDITKKILNKNRGLVKKENTTPNKNRQLLHSPTNDKDRIRKLYDGK